MKPPKTPPKKSPSGFAVLLEHLGTLPVMLLHPRVRTLTLMLAFLGVLGGVWYAMWRNVGPRVVAGPEYRITEASIELTPKPTWIRTDLCEDVFKQANLSSVELSVVDTDLCERLARAFALHPWIAKVEQVTKSYPAHVKVDVVYRRPVCMVEVPAGPDEVPDDEAADAAHRPRGKSGGLYPIDAMGVLLPTADFSRVEARTYPRLSEIRTLPLGPVGENWGDPRVTGGAEVAAVLFEDWQKLRLYRIVASEHPEPGGPSHEFSYDLYTRDGTHIVWGHRPGTTLAGEVSAAVKLDRLHKHLSHDPTAGTTAPAIELDIRYERGVSATPLTAREPVDKKTE